MRRIAAGASALAALALVAAGCSAKPSNAGSSRSDQDAKFEAARVKFEACMRENGVDMDTGPGPGGKGSLVRIGEGVDPAVVEAADEACRHHLEGATPKLSEEERRDLQEGALKFAECMRAEGVDVPDPDFGGGRTRLRIAREPGSMQDPAFEAAEKKCRQHMPEPPDGRARVVEPR